MIKRKSYKYPVFASLLFSSVLISGCHTSNSTANNKRSFDISVSNVTANQPLSPIAVVLHNSGYQAWVDGQAASAALEQLAEGGDNSALITEANAHTAKLQTTSGSGAIGPGGSEQFQVSADNASDAQLTLISMLVNTNDAYTGVNAVKLSDLAVGQSLKLTLPAWDAGTEAHSEAQGTIPGPADGGEGFNAERDDILDLVTIHRGVVTSDDGFTTSILDQSHRFDNPVARVTITRTE